jgi:hypothetical protein
MTEPTPPYDEGGASSASDPFVTCPQDCPSDFIINAPCRIIKADGGILQISVTEMPDYPAGNYNWETSSTKITLSTTTGSTITLTAPGNPSDARDAETITVTRTATGCSPIVKTVNVTVARVTFSKSNNQRYGYDDFDTPANPNDDHICVKSGGNTLIQVDIQGGVTGIDFIFVCDNGNIVTAPRATGSFEMRLTAELSTAKLNTMLHAKCTCPAATSFASIAVHVYREKRVEVVIAKIGTNLRFPDADYTSHQPAANEKLKEAVVIYRMTNFPSDNSLLRTHYDHDSNRALTFDIANSGGSELQAIGRAMTPTGTKVRVAIVREMKSCYYLSADVNRTDPTITVRAGRVFDYPAMPVTLGTGPTVEQVTVTSVSGNTLTIVRGAPAHDHAEGAPIEFPAAGWSSDPILVVEGTLTLDEIKWAIIHEVGHRALRLQDVNDRDNIMLYCVGGTDQRLRYCNRSRRYDPPGGSENQWDTIPR